MWKIGLDTHLRRESLAGPDGKPMHTARLAIDTNLISVLA